MSHPSVEQVADAVLYEGYLLYPYRPSSVKNRQRWTFGGIYPRAYSEAQKGADAWRMRTECLVAADEGARLTVRVRFLHLLERTAGELPSPLADWPAGGDLAFRPVPLLRIGERSYPSWQEATEREVRVDDLPVTDLLGGPRRLPISFPASRDLEPLREGEGGPVVGVLAREHEAITAEAEVSATLLAPGRAQLRIEVRNLAPMPGDADDRARAVRRALISTHTILHVRDGAFISLIDPPADWKEAAGACENKGTWPVLAGPAGSTDTLLSSPIILYDHPEVAPESPGGLFDSTEIDEILTLRILTLTEEEKAEMCAVDPRARELLERTEALARDQLMGMHGTFRGKGV